MSYFRFFLVLFSIVFCRLNTLYSQCTGKANFSSNAGCKDVSLTFTNGSATGATRFTWIWGDGSSSLVTTSYSSVNHTFSASGTYKVKLIWTDGTCLDTIEKSVNIYKTTASVQADTSICISVPSITLGGSPSGGIWKGTGISGSRFSTSGLSAGTYSLKYVYTDPTTGCKDSAIRKVTLLAKPTVAFTFNNDSTCSGAKISFDNKSTGSTNYLWSFGNGKTSTDKNPIITYDAFGGGYGSYSIKLIVTNSNGCKDSLTKTIYVKKRPNPELDDT